MPEVIVDNESREILKEFYKAYQEELKRESIERDKQAILDSDQAKVSDDEKIIAKEKQESDEKALKEFREEMLERLAKSNENSQKLIEILSDDTQVKATTESNQDFQDNVMIGFWLIIIVMVVLACADSFSKSFNKDW